MLRVTLSVSTSPSPGDLTGPPLLTRGYRISQDYSLILEICRIFDRADLLATRGNDLKAALLPINERQGRE